ncbi:hypothetical protein evm_008178 [Chilo suppressalis]|nr:hypothetical protein evm_008178 [Chilo suppressalis]
MPGIENVSDGGRVRGRGRARSRGGGARGTRGGLRGARGARDASGGGATRQPQVTQDLRIGNIAKRPAGRPLEAPLHAKRRRTLPVSDSFSPSSSCSSLVPDGSAPQPQPSTSSFASPTHSGASSPAFVPSPVLFVECGNTSTTSRQNPRRLFRDDEIVFFHNYGTILVIFN